MKNTLDPTWNHLPRALLLYALPLALLSACLRVEPIGWSRDFWVPFLWGLIIPGINTGLRAGRPWAFKDFQNRDGYTPMVALIHAVGWYLPIQLTDSVWIAMAVFYVFFLIYDGLLIRYGLLVIYAVDVEKHRRGVLSVLSYFGLTWWAYIAVALALTHRFGSDTPIGILLCAALMMAPTQFNLLFFVRRKDRPDRFAGIRNVAVIGGGWSGIYAVKWLEECGLNATCFEATDEIGGVWVYREKSPGGVARNTRVTTSKHFLHASDFPMKASLPDFPGHADVRSHLRDYVRHFGIQDRFRLNTRVVELKGKDGDGAGDGWRVVTEGSDGVRRHHEFDAVIVSSGPQGECRLDASRHPVYGSFTGKLMHAGEYKQRSDIGRDETILVVGAGESAADIVDECVDEGARVVWAFHRGQWFVDRNIGGPFATDHFVAPGLRALLGRFLNLEYLIRRFLIGFSIELFWGRGGHGIDAWIPRAPYLHQFLNKSRDAISDVYSGRVLARRAPSRIQGRRVWFRDDAEGLEVDRIILATGYQPFWPFLERQPEPLFKKVFTPNDPTLAFVGFARPVIGSIPSLSELQSRWVANVWSGRAVLPNRRRREVDLFHDERFHRRNFSDSSQMRVLVDQEVYSNELAGFVNATVPWFRLILRGPRTLIALLISPWTAFKFHLRDPDPKRRAAAIDNIRRELPGRRHPLYFLLAEIALLSLAGGVGLGLALWFVPFATLTAGLAAGISVAAFLIRFSERRVSPAADSRGIGIEPDPETIRNGVDDPAMLGDRVAD